MGGGEHSIYLLCHFDQDLKHLLFIVLEAGNSEVEMPADMVSVRAPFLACIGYLLAVFS